MEVKLDLVEGHSVKKTTKGWEVDRIAIVTGMSGDGDARVINAMTVTGMPEILDVHPVESSVFLKEITLIELTNAEVKFKLTYRPPSTGSSSFVPDSLEVGASVQQTETNKDKNDTEMHTSYIYKAGTKRSRHDTPLLVDDPPVIAGAKVPIFLPQNTYSIQKLESSSPKTKAMNYVGKINSSEFDGYPAKSLMCMAIVGRSNDGGSNYNVTYRFQYKANTWVQEVIFIKDDGKPAYPTDANSKKNYDIYDEINFNSLGL